MSTCQQQQVAAINYCNNLCNLDTILTHLLQQLILEALKAAGVRSSTLKVFKFGSVGVGAVLPVAWS